MKDARWITHKGAGASDNATYYFKKSFTLDTVDNALFEISAQARYKLFINGEFVACGPCKGTREKTYFDALDVTKYLRVGENEIFCEVLQLVSDDMQVLFLRTEWRQCFSAEGVLKLAAPFGSQLLIEQ